MVNIDTDKESLCGTDLVNFDFTRNDILEALKELDLEGEIHARI